MWIRVHQIKGNYRMKHQITEKAFPALKKMRFIS